MAGFVALWQLRSFFRHLAATITHAFGAKGRGKVLRCVKMRDMGNSGTIVVAQFEVTPDDGSPAFVDQETLNLGEQGLKKIVAGNTLLVRFDSAREHVYPQAPLTLV